MMYEALVARVRYHIQKANFMGLKEAESTLLLKEAGDAIKELQGRVEVLEKVADKWCAAVPRWTPTAEDKPSDFVSVQAHMTDAGNFPSVREAYVVNDVWFFPALKEFHPVDAWRRFDEPPKEGET